jgi:hypothetical protein
MICTDVAKVENLEGPEEGNVAEDSPIRYFVPDRPLSEQRRQ